MNLFDDYEEWFLLLWEAKNLGISAEEVKEFLIEFLERKNTSQEKLKEGIL
jgi:hypothetical protein